MNIIIPKIKFNLCLKVYLNLYRSIITLNYFEINLLMIALKIKYVKKVKIDCNNNKLKDINIS